MKLRASNQRNPALTRTDVLAVVITSCLFVVYFLHALAAIHSPRRPASCLANLKQIGLAFRRWEADNGDKYPMAVSVANGGARELVATGNVAACFRVMSNELSTTKILICPQDTHRKCATNFSVLKNSNISYFVSLDAAEIYPQMILDGDDNFAISGVPVKPGILLLPCNAPVAWVKTKNRIVGNFGMADGSVQQVTTAGLKNALIQTGIATNRLAIP